MRQDNIQDDGLSRGDFDVFIWTICVGIGIMFSGEVILVDLLQYGSMDIGAILAAIFVFVLYSGVAFLLTRRSMY
jgi:hypothetical protein